MFQVSLKIEVQHKLLVMMQGRSTCSRTMEFGLFSCIMIYTLPSACTTVSLAKQRA